MMQVIVPAVIFVAIALTVLCMGAVIVGAARSAHLDALDEQSTHLPSHGRAKRAPTPKSALDPSNPVNHI